MTLNLKIDRTFHEQSLYGSALWCSVALGCKSLAAFERELPSLIERGFPEPDTRRDGRVWVKVAVTAWIESQNQPKVSAPQTKGVENHDAF